MSWRFTIIKYFGPGGFSGTTFGDWLKVLRDNRFAIDSKYWPRAAFITCNSILNSLIRRWETVRYSSAIAGTSVPPPLFVLGLGGAERLTCIICWRWMTASHSPTRTKFCIPIRF